MRGSGWGKRLWREVERELEEGCIDNRMPQDYPENTDYVPTMCQALCLHQGRAFQAEETVCTKALG